MAPIRSDERLTSFVTISADNRRSVCTKTGQKTLRTIFGYPYIVTDILGEGLGRIYIVADILSKSLGRLDIVTNIFGEHLGGFNIPIHTVRNLQVPNNHH